MDVDKGITLGAAKEKQVVQLNLAMANRHGLVAGATGTGKTVTLQVLAEGFSKQGVPVFTADVKGDLSGIAAAGKSSGKIDERLEQIPLSGYTQRGYPVIFWDIFGKRGHPVRTTISEMGPLILSRLLQLNDTQDGILHLAFRIADDEGLLLLDLKDLRAMLLWMAEHKSEIRSEYGNVSSQSVAAIQRKLLNLDDAGGEQFFGEPALKIEHLMQHDFSGNGVIGVLDARELMTDPRIYSTFLLWLLSELFEELEEVGDADKPKLVFFFDEAHLLFKNAPKPLLEKIETVVRLIRSKGVGVFFVTQNPLDIPDSVLGQLGNRIQHALRAFTPKTRKAVRAAAKTFPENPELDVETVITELGVGEALISTLASDGRPSPAERVLVSPPESQIGPLEQSEREEKISRSPLKGVYEDAVDRESAYELLKEREEENSKKRETQIEKTKPGRKRQGVMEAMFKSVARSIGSQIGRQIVRGVLGSMLGGKK